MLSARSQPLFILIAVLLLLPLTAFAIVPPDGADGSLLKAISTPEMAVAPSPVRLGPVEKSQRMADFSAKHGSDWQATWDKRSDRPLLIQGSGIPVFAGNGNMLKTAAPRDLAKVATVLEGFLDAKAGLLKVSGMDLRFDAAGSSEHGGYFYNVEFQQHVEGVPVEGAIVFVRVNHGNVIQFGTRNVADVRINTLANLNREEAFEQVLFESGLFADQVSEIRDAGTLKIFPKMLDGESPGEAYLDKAGAGYEHLLGWQFTFKVAGDTGTYEAVVDAHSGELVRLLDQTSYATVQGGVLPTTSGEAELTEAFTFLSVSDGSGTKTTDGSGNYTYDGGTASTSLDGRYIAINDNCGSINVTGDGSGNIDLGSSSGTDCDTPGFGGAGNTHSARSGHWHLTNINRKAAGFLAGNSWLDGTLTANMNINNTCNAYWDGSTVNFYRSGGGCGNTGEIAAVFLHEWGHGMDENSGGTASENGSGEAVGDTFAFLEQKASCIGTGFFTDGSTCYNCDTCSGVRDVEEFSLTGNHTIASPATVADDNGINCDRYSCPYKSLGPWEYAGPMGYQGHCESYIASTANWDLTQSLVAAHGSAGWDVMDSIWYGSLNPSKSAYQVVDGGRCNPSATVDGCGSDNWYTVFLAVDDDNGNLSDGTPNGCRIWDAFDAHGIACGSRPACSGGGTGGDSAPTADFTYSCTDLACDFTDQSTDDGTVSSWSWDFGDGATSTAQNPSHTFGADGSYTVSLTVTDDAGQTGSTSQSVTAGTSSGDTTGPVISNVSSVNNQGNQFTISFNTDEPATSTITFTSGASGTFNAETSLTTDHSVTFNGSKGVLYEYYIDATDGAGNTTTDGPHQHQND